MHYYQHNIGDFNNATRHLTRVERALYRDAIELCYDTEEPLISDFDALARKLLAREKEEKDALKVVLGEFFTLTDDGYRNCRCDSEIEKYHLNSMAKRKAGQASAAKRKQNATRVEQMNNECATKQETLTIKQETENSNQEQVTKKQKTESQNTMPSKLDACKQILEFLNAKTGKAFKAVDSNINLIKARLKEGHAEHEILAVIERKVAEWPPGHKQHQYLRPMTLFRASNFNNYVGELGVETPEERQTREMEEFISGTSGNIFEGEVMP